MNPSLNLRQISRRRFLAGCGACAACAAAPWLEAIPANGLTNLSLMPQEKAKVRLVFTHSSPDQATWPHVGYDYERRKKDLTDQLVRACPNIEFLPATALNPGEARKILETDQGVDGYVVYLLGIWTGVAMEIAGSGQPTIFVDDLYSGSGEFLIAYAEAMRKGLKVAGVSSSRFADVVQAVKSFEYLRKMRASVVLAVAERAELPGNPQAIQEVFGTQIPRVPVQELNQAYGKVDPAQAQKWAQQWTRRAKKVIEPSRAEIEKSAAMYLAMQDLMVQHRAQATAIDCLFLFYGGRLPAYPCLGLFQLNNDGWVGACEADLRSAITMLLMTYVAGRPGFISDPVIDTSRNQIIYAHCVCSNKVFGPAGRANPYHIRSHSEDRKGAAIRSLLPLGEMTTTLKFDCARKEVIMHQGMTVANIDDDKGCRTKVAVEVKGDIRKLMTEWDRWRWHRVTFFGDYRQPVEILSALLGFKVVMEA